MAAVVKKTVLVGSVCSEYLVSTLSKQFEVIAPFYNAKEKSTAEKMAIYYENIPKAHGVIGFNCDLSEKIILQADNLECVATTSVGYDSLNIPVLTKQGICAANTPSVLSNTVADLGLSLMLAAARRICELDRWTKNGNWKGVKEEESLHGLDINGKTLGIVGLGDIGAEVARRAHFGFRMPIIYSGNTRKENFEKEFNATFRTFEELCKESDFIVVICPLTPQTFQMFKAEQFEMMKPTAVFVNIARGKVVDESALIEALQQKKIFAAGLDVYETEPLAESPLFSLPNVVTVPHVGSGTAATHRAIEDRAIENLTNVLLHDKQPVSFLNSAVWDSRRSKKD